MSGYIRLNMLVSPTLSVNAPARTAISDVKYTLAIVFATHKILYSKYLSTYTT